VNVVLQGAARHHWVLEETALDFRRGKEGLLAESWIEDGGREPVDKESYGNCRVKT